MGLSWVCFVVGEHPNSFDYQREPAVFHCFFNCWVSFCTLSLLRHPIISNTRQTLCPIIHMPGSCSNTFLLIFFYYFFVISPVSPVGAVGGCIYFWSLLKKCLAMWVWVGPNPIANSTPRFLFSTYPSNLSIYGHPFNLVCHTLLNLFWYNSNPFYLFFLVILLIFFLFYGMILPCLVSGFITV